MIETIRGADTHRVRRWDAVVLGGALPGLVAAIRLAQRGARVVVLEEAGAGASRDAIREPFLLTGASQTSVMGRCLRALGVPLIDQRRFVPDDVALQVALPDARLDIGRAPLTAAELVAWGLAKPDPARALMRALDEAARAEQDALLGAALVRPLRRLRGLRPRLLARTVFFRGLPKELTDPSPAVRRLFETLVAVSNDGSQPPSALAQARSLGRLLEGGVALAGGEGLRSLLRRRIRALLGTFQPIAGGLRFVSVSGQPGVADSAGDIVSGRLLIGNAPASRVAGAMTGPVPAFLANAAPGEPTLELRLRGDAGVLPEGMADRVALVPEDPALPPLSLRVQRQGGAGRRIEVIVRAGGPVPADRDAALRAMLASVRALLPFSEERLVLVAESSPRWDVDDRPRPAGRTAWPGAAIDLRLHGRPPIAWLDRAPLAGLGVEGELMLGWRAGDRLTEELR